MCRAGAPDWRRRAEASGGRLGEGAWCRRSGHRCRAGVRRDGREREEVRRKGARLRRRRARAGAARAPAPSLVRASARAQPFHPRRETPRRRSAPGRPSGAAESLVLQPPHRRPEQGRVAGRPLRLPRREAGRARTLQAHGHDPLGGPQLGRTPHPLRGPGSGAGQGLAALRDGCGRRIGEDAPPDELHPRGGGLLLAARRAHRVHVGRRRTGASLRVWTFAHEQQLPPRSHKWQGGPPDLRPGLELVPERAQRRTHSVRALGILRRTALLQPRAHDDEPRRHAPDGLLRLERLLAQPLRQSLGDSGRQRQVHRGRDWPPLPQERKARPLRRRARARRTQGLRPDAARLGQAAGRQDHGRTLQWQLSALPAAVPAWQFPGGRRGQVLPGGDEGVQECALGHLPRGRLRQHHASRRMRGLVSQRADRACGAEASAVHPRPPPRERAVLHDVLRRPLPGRGTQEPSARNGEVRPHLRLPLRLQPHGQPPGGRRGVVVGHEVRPRRGARDGEGRHLLQRARQHADLDPAARRGGAGRAAHAFLDRRHAGRVRLLHRLPRESQRDGASAADRPARAGHDQAAGGTRQAAHVELPARNPADPPAALLGLPRQGPVRRGGEVSEGQAGRVRVLHGRLPALHARRQAEPGGLPSDADPDEAVQGRPRGVLLEELLLPPALRAASGSGIGLLPPEPA